MEIYNGEGPIKGDLTARNVLRRIKSHYEKEKKLHEYIEQKRDTN